MKHLTQNQMRLLFVAPPGDEALAVHAMQAAGKRADQQQMEVVKQPHIFERFYRSDGRRAKNTEVQP